MSISAFVKKIERGMKVEMEHAKTVNCDMVTIARIALDHIEEDPMYYKKLAKMEGHR